MDKMPTVFGSVLMSILSPRALTDRKMEAELMEMTKRGSEKCVCDHTYSSHTLSGVCMACGCDTYEEAR